jgi:hypothetical protein
MTDLMTIGFDNLLSPLTLAFALGIGAALLRAGLEVPEPVHKGLSLFLILAIGIKGGATLRDHPVEDFAPALAAGVLLSFLLPLLAYPALRALVRLPRIDAAAVAAHYGSVSLVTFVSAVELLRHLGVDYGGHMIAVLAAMEAPGIVTGLLLAWAATHGEAMPPLRQALRQAFCHGSVVLLLGGMAIGLLTGREGIDSLGVALTDVFQAALCLFLLGLGVAVGNRLRDDSVLTPRLVVFGMAMPIVGAAAGAGAALALGLPLGDAVLLTVLSASASYIAAPAVLRTALPAANPAVYVTLALGVTFPFNLIAGIPLYYAVLSALGGSTGS